jgi:lipopolysaccharide biosynthesis glycosyltransferase
MCATDDRYAMPLAAALASVFAHRSPSQSRHATNFTDPPRISLQLVLLDGGMSDPTWARLSRTISQLGIMTIRVRADRAAVQHLNVSHHISHTAYFRLLSSVWLPTWISRVIYLDCDVIALADVTELWRQSLEQPTNDAGFPNEVWAVPDIACPYLDPRNACEEFSRFAPYFAALHPVPNFRELGLQSSAWYFNSGVMVLDLTAWRRNDRSQQLLDCLQRNQRHVWCWDQYALNVVFHQRWGNLPLAWNFGAHAYDYAAAPELAGKSPLLPEQYQAMWNAPRLLHYTTEIKPWHYYSFHPQTQQFYAYLAHTAWADWRPAKPGFKTWWHVKTFLWQKSWIALARRLRLGATPR